jgi:hypothetical protein
MIDKTMCEVLWRNIWDFYVNIRVKVGKHPQVILAMYLYLGQEQKDACKRNLYYIYSFVWFWNIVDHWFVTGVCHRSYIIAARIIKFLWREDYRIQNLIILSSKINLFSPWYSLKIAELALNNNHSLTHYIEILTGTWSLIICNKRLNKILLC